jgi:uncharacterized membrane protein YtjA (UPF0391 family)
MAPSSRRSLIFLILATLLGIVGFGSDFARSQPSLDPYAVLPGIAIGLAKVLFIIFLIFFVVSLFFGERLHGRNP